MRSEKFGASVAGDGRGGLWKLIALVLLQLVVEFPVYSDQSLGWIASQTLKEGIIHA
jgi:hypothetical protein